MAAQPHTENPHEEPLPATAPYRFAVGVDDADGCVRLEALDAASSRRFLLVVKPEEVVSASALVCVTSQELAGLLKCAISSQGGASLSVSREEKEAVLVCTLALETMFSKRTIELSLIFQLPQDQVLVLTQRVVALTLEVERLQGLVSPSLSESGLFDALPASAQIVIEDLDFTSLQLIGKGAYAHVYRSKYQGRDVAVKRNTLDFKATNEGEEVLRFMMKEVPLWLELDHPNVIKLLGFHKAEFFLLIMELAEVNLKHHLHPLFRRPSWHPVPWDECLRYSSHTVAGLQYLHARDIIHRDLKAENVLLSFPQSADNCSRVAMLADFGISRKLNSDGLLQTISLPRQQLGTPGWMAPEILASPSVQSKPIDIYALGVTLYEILQPSCQWGYGGLALTREALLRHERPPAPPTDSLDPSQALFFQLIGHCWAQHPDDRPPLDFVAAVLQSLIAHDLPAASAVLSTRPLPYPASSPKAVSQASDTPVFTQSPPPAPPPSSSSAPVSSKPSPVGRFLRAIRTRDSDETTRKPKMGSSTALTPPTQPTPSTLLRSPVSQHKHKKTERDVELRVARGTAQREAEAQLQARLKREAPAPAPAERDAQLRAHQEARIRAERQAEEWRGAQEAEQEIRIRAKREAAERKAVQLHAEWEASELRAEQREESEHDRDLRLVNLFREMNVSQVIQDTLFSQGLDVSNIHGLKLEDLEGVGLKKFPARSLLAALLVLATGAASSPLLPSSPAACSSADYNLHSRRELPHLTDEESQPRFKGAQGMIYWAKYAGAPCVLKRFIHEINRPEFAREVSAWKKFRHASIVQLYDFLTPPYAVIVMEQMVCSLHDLLKNFSKQLSFARRVEMGGQIAAGVSYLHAEGFIHRDIKSLNVLVRGKEVKLADFGDTRSAEQLQTLVSLKGTTRWIAPELYLGARPTQASDVFAMGMTLWELLCRQIPFVELGNDAAAITHNITHALRPAFAVHMDSGDDAGEDVIGRFKEVIICCWSQLPHMRPSAVDTLKMLNQILPAPTSTSTPPEPVEPPPVTDSEITRQMGRALQNNVMIGGYGSFSSSS